MRLFQIFKAWVELVEILGQVEHLLRNLDDFIFWKPGHPLHGDDQLIRQQSHSLQLFTNLERHEKCADRDQTRLPSSQLVIMKRHLGEVERHFLDQKFLTLSRFAVLGKLSLLGLGQARVPHVAYVEDKAQIHFQKVKDRRCRNPVMDCFQQLQLCCLDLLDLESLVCNLFVDNLHFQWQDVFVF